LLASQVLLLAVAWLFMPQLVGLLAPGFVDEPEKFSLAVALTRITFPYLLFITLVTLYSGSLNAQRRFAAAAFAPVLLNVVMIGTLALAFLFPGAGEAAGVGVLLSGIGQLALMVVAAKRADALATVTVPRFDPDVKQFFKAVVPAVIGSAGVQIAIFADTIIASFLPTGSVSAIYYADRIYQLPIGVIGIAAGTVLLPEMSRRLAAGDPGAAFHAQNRTMALTVALSAPFLVAFLTISDLIMRGVFLRGRFTLEAATASASVLAAYGIGLMAVVLIRSAVASFQAQGDTRTPMIVSLVAVVANVALKFVLYKPMGAAGLALATATGAWINFGLLVMLALRARSMQPDATLMKVCGAVAVASAALAGIALMGDGPLQRLTANLPFPTEMHLTTLSMLGLLAYGVVLMIGFRLLGVRLAQSKRPSPKT
jgi:putative peptidoglycan lipid II flippase